MANNELKPCPFCGAHLPHMWSLTLDGQEHSITCTECPGRAVFNSSTREQAIAAWNRRATPAQAEPSDALPERPCSLRGTGKCACPTACQLNMDAARGQTQSYVILGQQGGGDAARRAQFQERMRLFQIGKCMEDEEIDDQQQYRIGAELIAISGICTSCYGGGQDGDAPDANGEGGWVGLCGQCDGTGLAAIQAQAGEGAAT